MRTLLSWRAVRPSSRRRGECCNAGPSRRTHSSSRSSEGTTWASGPASKAGRQPRACCSSCAFPRALRSRDRSRWSPARGPARARAPASDRPVERRMVRGCSRDLLSPFQRCGRDGPAEGRPFFQSLSPRVRADGCSVHSLLLARSFVLSQTRSRGLWDGLRSPRGSTPPANSRRRRFRLLNATWPNGDSATRRSRHVSRARRPARARRPREGARCLGDSLGSFVWARRSDAAHGLELYGVAERRVGRGQRCRPGVRPSKQLFEEYRHRLALPRPTLHRCPSAAPALAADPAGGITDRAGDGTRVRWRRLPMAMGLR